MGDLVFPIEQNPLWRFPEQQSAASTNGCEEVDTSGPAMVSSPLSSTEMLDAIGKRIDKYDTLPEKAKRFCKNLFSKGMAVQYVHHSNIGESVGTQEFEDTLALLEELLKAKADAASQASFKRQTSSDQRETINTCRALKMFHDKFQGSMQETGMLTVQQLCEAHEILLEGLHLKNGKIRVDGDDVYTQTEEGIHYYPEPWRAEQRFYALIDHHNINMEHYGEKKAEMTTRGKVEFLVKCAARLLFEFVDTHPFSDGNGRMCRLLANYVVSLITPFPVAVYHSASLSKRSHRNDYIRAIVKCRKNPQEGPRDLAAMILEGIYLGWESLFENLTALKLLEPGLELGPIVVKKSDLQPLDEKLERLYHRGSVPEEITCESLSEIVRRAILAEDVSTLRPPDYKRTLVHVKEGVSLVVDIFP